ncbi:MAG TPA: hypothetical protein VJW75_00450 [Candidatus Eisenbacteria bacterium]|nr:hypothetical protein [Candidatus Eisenbacteria bacterium]
MARAAPLPLRVEQALRLLPDVGELSPLRALIISTSRPRPDRSPYDTVGKRLVDPAELRAHARQVLKRAEAARASLVEASIGVLELEQARNRSDAVDALIDAGMSEERAGRQAQAHAWFECALHASQELRDRRPKGRALRGLGRVAAEAGRFAEAGRALEECLAIAETERDSEEAALTCRELGDLEARRCDWRGAEAWYRRGARSEDVSPALAVSLHLGVADAACERKDAVAADAFLRLAHDASQELGDPSLAVPCATAQGRLLAFRGDHVGALLAYQKAMASAGEAGLPAHHEMEARLGVCRLYLLWRELPNAIEEFRRAEDVAIRNGLRKHLILLYSIMGRAIGRDADETGFVFFEKALELCRDAEPIPWLEAEVYREYGAFRGDLGESEEARAYSGRALELLRGIESVPRTPDAGANLPLPTKVVDPTQAH